jgi:C-terminal processing protease CtpA/Prc
LIREPRGQFLEQADGSSTFQFSSIPKSSHLSQVVGLQPGDKLISVNGHKIQGVGFSAAKAIYEQVRDAERFALKIEREGRFEVLTFTIKRNSRP